VHNGLKSPSRKLGYALILVAVFLASYAIVFFVISLTPYGHYSARVYSAPNSRFRYGNSTTMGGAWLEQLLGVGPEPGANNVSRDTSIVIVATRPERVYNISFSPNVPIAKESYIVHGGFGPSSVQTVYPAGLLQPNTTYNVSATVAGTPSWWVFTTSSGPSRLTFVYQLSSYDAWVALTIAILVTSIVSVARFVRKNTLATT